MKSLKAFLEERGLINDHLSKNVRLLLSDAMFAENTGFNDGANGCSKKSFRFFWGYAKTLGLDEKKTATIASFLYESYLYGYEQGENI